jgi:septal ring factor EnvC (AmiA/AmiB activator)
MPKTEAEIRASLDAVIEDVERNQRVYGWFAGNVGQLALATRDLVTRMEVRFDQVDQRFEQVDQRFEQVDQRFEQVDQRFDKLERRIDRFEENTATQFGLVNDSLRKLDARMERLVGYIVRDEQPEQPEQPEQAERAGAGVAG